jgi:hypothetical protein
MYKVLMVLDNNVGLLQQNLNDAALEGFRWIHSFQLANRIVVVMAQPEMSRGPGRPKKVEEEDKLGK